jgi:hypothetical protein
LASKYTLIELRHDCSGSEEHPDISREMWTSVVYRLKSPIYERCQDKLDKAFTWTFDLKQPISCLAMLGCHDLEGYQDTVGDETSYDFNVTVSKHSAVGTNTNDDDEQVRSTADTFQIKRNGVQKFYTLNGQKG